MANDNKAKKQTEQKPMADENKITKFVAAPPDNWGKVGGQVDVDGWYDNKTLAVVVGRIAGYIEYSGQYGPRKAVVVTLANAVAAQVKDGQVRVEKVLPEGSNLGVVLNRSIAELFEYDRGTRVWLKCEGKVKRKAGDMWNFTCRVEPKARKRAISESAPAAKNHEVEETEESLDDIPF